MMASDELSSNEERIADSLLANLHLIYFGTQVAPDDCDRVAKRTLEIAFNQCNRDGLINVLKNNTHAALREKVLALL
jgi:hypothetical protein